MISKIDVVILILILSLFIVLPIQIGLVKFYPNKYERFECCNTSSRVNTTQSEQSQSPQYGNPIAISPIVPFGILILIGILFLFKKRSGISYSERRPFSSEVKKQVLTDQGYKCAICGKSAGVWDYDHIDGDRSNNDIKNCQALCPNCHAKKTRGLINIEKKMSRFWKIVIVLTVFAVIVSMAYTYLK